MLSVAIVLKILGVIKISHFLKMRGKKTELLENTSVHLIGKYNSNIHNDTS